MKLLPSFLSRFTRRQSAAATDTASLDSSAGHSRLNFGNFYDAATGSQSRSSLIHYPVPAWREITPLTRRTVLGKLRSLEANLGLIQRMKGQVGKYSVGRGIFPIPQTTDEAWNEAAAMQFDDWANNPGVCDVAGAMTFWERQRYHAETYFSENESFDALVSSSVSGAPQLQLIDSSEIGDGLFRNQDPTVIDGVRVNEQNRIISYLVSIIQPNVSTFAQLEFTEISASDMIHVVRRKRPNQVRGISPFAPAINPAIDVMDLDALIVASAKLHNALGIKVTKKNADAGKKGITGQVNKLLDAQGNVTHVDEKFIRGAMVQYLGLDEDIDVVSSDRPTENLLNYLVYRLRHICLTTGLPFEIVWDLASLGGATARIALTDAQWFFDSIQDTINDRFNQRVWVWWAASMMKNGDLPRCNDPRWWSCFWLGPPKLTADAGRTMSGQIDAMHAGLDTWESYYARTEQRHWQRAIKQRIQELAYVRDECAKVAIDPLMVFAPTPGSQVLVTQDTTGGTKP